MKRIFFSAASAVAVLGLCVAAPSRADERTQDDLQAFSSEKGQDDLDAATEYRVTVRSLADLGRVVRLCESAMEKGLSKENTKYAEQLLSSTLLQRAAQLCIPIFDRTPPNAKWPQFRTYALRDLQKTIELDDQVAEAHYMIARLRSLPGGDRDKAFQAAGKAVELFVDNDVRQSKAYGLRGTLTEDKQKRLEDFNKAVELDANNLRALRLRGLYYLDEKEYDKALADMKKILEKEFDNVTALHVSAQALTALEQNAEALKQVSESLKLDPKNAVGLFIRARIYAIEEEHEKALEDLNGVLDASPQHIGALMLRARLRHQQQEIATARADVERVLQLRPGLQSAAILRTELLAAQGKVPQAISDARALVRANPDNAALRIQLATLYNRDERPRKAIDVFTELLADDAQNAGALRGRGDAYLNVAKHSEAIADFQAALKQEPKNTGVLNNLAWVLATSPEQPLRDGSRAIKLAVQACEQTKYKQAHMLSTLAAGHAEVGDFDEAVKWAAKAVELSDESVLEQLEKELASYKQKKPWRELKEVEEKPEPDAPSDSDLKFD